MSRPDRLPAQFMSALNAVYVVAQAHKASAIQTYLADAVIDIFAVSRHFGYLESSRKLAAKEICILITYIT